MLLLIPSGHVMGVAHGGAARGACEVVLRDVFGEGLLNYHCEQVVICTVLYLNIIAQ